MAKDFIKNRVGSNGLVLATRQQEQLSYFTQSSIQENITQAYIEQWIERKYAGSDDFLNWVKTVFRTDNFLSFYKYLRFPIPSSELINERVKTPLSRVFFSEDSYFNYTISGNTVPTPEELNSKMFDKKMFNALLFNYNDILVTDLKSTNEPVRRLIPIKNVIAIESEDSIIHRIAYSASMNILTDNEEKLVAGFLFIDNKEYIFYDKDLNPLIIIPHDLGECPADYISSEPFKDKDSVRKSMFSYLRDKMEEYVFLKTLQRMTEPNGAIPIVTKLKTTEKLNKDIKGESSKEPMSVNSIGGQRANIGKEVQGSVSPLQTGSIINVPILKKNDGSIDMDAVKNFLNFFWIPTESLKYLNDRIKEIEQGIIVSLLGDFSEANESAKNELQVSKSFVSKEDKLRSLSLDLTRIRQRSDFKFLALKHGRDNVIVDLFFGADFFTETQDDIYNLLEKSPNPIESKNLLLRLSKNRNRFNPQRSDREVLLYNLLPYAHDTDFTKAIDKEAVGDVTFQYQTRFNYWIDVFEARFGDILQFFNMMEGTESEKLMLINNLIIGIINENDEAIKDEPVTN